MKHYTLIEIIAACVVLLLPSCGKYEATIVVEHKGKVEYVAELKVCESDKAEDKETCLKLLKKLFEKSK